MIKICFVGVFLFVLLFVILVLVNFNVYLMCVYVEVGKIVIVCVYL